MDDAPEDVDESSALLEALGDLPLFDDMYLRMQAQNIAMVNAHLINLEHDMYGKYMETDRTPVPEALFTSAISQMWIFSLYELLRTWRQRLQEVLRHAERFRQGAETAVEVPKGEVDIQVNYPHVHALSRAEKDDSFLAEIKEANEKLQPTFREIEGVRVTLAKHEIPKGRGLKAANVGYARIDPLSGSMNYFFQDNEGFSNVVSRAKIVEQLLRTFGGRCDT